MYAQCINSTYTVHNSKICLPKSTNAGQKKKKGENVNWRKRGCTDVEPKRPHICSFQKKKRKDTKFYYKIAQFYQTIKGQFSVYIYIYIYISFSKCIYTFFYHPSLQAIIESNKQ